MSAERGVARDCLAWIFAGVLTTTILAPAGITALFGARRLPRAMLKYWARRFCDVFGVEVAVEDRTGESYANPPYVYAILNQTSLLEAAIYPQGLRTPSRTIVNFEFALIPFVGWIYAALGGIVVVRGSPAQAAGALRRAAKACRAGDNVSLSVEGARSRDGRLLPYKNGAASIALLGGATVVPIAIHGAAEAWPPGEWRIRPGRVRVVVLPMIRTSKGDKGADALTAKLRALAETELAAERD